MSGIFIPESQSMARQYLFQVLASNDSLLASDTLFLNFYNEMLAEAEGQLNAVERRFETYGKMDSTFAPMLQNIDSLINQYNYYIEHFDEMRDSIEQSGINPDSLREQWIFHIENLDVTRVNIVMQHNAVISGEMYEGELTNNIINGDEQNEINSTLMNDLFMQLEEVNYTNLNELYLQLLSIAEQCPYYGGEAVYRARSVLELVNDSLVYNDDVNCLQYGIYRQGVIADENKNAVIIVKPNPANEYVFVKVLCNDDEKFAAEISDAYGRIVYKDDLSCNKENKIITRGLKQSIYTLLVKTTQGNKTYKIAIIR